MAFRPSNKLERYSSNNSPHSQELYNNNYPTIQTKNKENLLNLRSPLQKFDEDDDFTYVKPKQTTNFLTNFPKKNIVPQVILNNNPYLARGGPKLINFSSSSSSSSENYENNLLDQPDLSDLNEKNFNFDDLISKNEEIVKEEAQKIPNFTNSSQSIPSLSVVDEKANEINIFQKAYILGLENVKNKKDLQEFKELSPILPRNKRHEYEEYEQKQTNKQENNIINNKKNIKIEKIIKNDDNINIISFPKKQQSNLDEFLMIPNKNILKSPLENKKTIDKQGSSNKRNRIFENSGSNKKNREEDGFNKNNLEGSGVKQSKNSIINNFNSVKYDINTEENQKYNESFNNFEQNKNSSLENLSKAIENFRKINEAFNQSQNKQKKEINENLYNNYSQQQTTIKKIIPTIANDIPVLIADRINLINKKKPIN